MTVEGLEHSRSKLADTMRDAAIDMAEKAKTPPASPVRDDAFPSQDAKNYAAAALSLSQAWVTVARSDQPRNGNGPRR